METRTTVDTAAARAMALRLNNNEVVDPGGVGHDWINDLADALDAARAELAAIRAHCYGPGNESAMDQPLARAKAAEAETVALRERLEDADREIHRLTFPAADNTAWEDLERERNDWRERAERAEAELDIIANATPSQWEPVMRDQFQAWAQNRARHASGVTPPTA